MVCVRVRCALQLAAQFRDFRLEFLDGFREQGNDRSIIDMAQIRSVTPYDRLRHHGLDILGNEAGLARTGIDPGKLDRTKRHYLRESAIRKWLGTALQANVG